MQTQGLLTQSQRVLVGLPCSAESCLAEYLTIGSPAATESRTPLCYRGTVKSEPSDTSADPCEVCQHLRRRSTCKDCGGGGICQHNRIRSRCKTCLADKDESMPLGLEEL